MAVYSYYCSDCETERDETFAMGTAPDKIPCVCGQWAERVFFPVHHRHVNAQGEPVRAPGSEWIGGETFDRTRFLAENPGAKKKR
jgi:hypothetical protein